MIVLNRRGAGRFRAAVRRRPRGLAPPISIQQTKDSLTLSAVLEEAITLRWPAHEGSVARLVVPWATLNAVEGNVGEFVTLDEDETGHLRCRWKERGQAKEVVCPSVPQPQRATCPRPQTMAAVDPALLVALHACGQTAGVLTTVIMPCHACNCAAGSATSSGPTGVRYSSGEVSPSPSRTTCWSQPYASSGGENSSESKTHISAGPRSMSSSRRGRGRSG